LKADVAEIRILLKADSTPSGKNFGSKVSGLELDAGGRPGLGEREAVGGGIG